LGGLLFAPRNYKIRKKKLKRGGQKIPPIKKKKKKTSLHNSITRFGRVICLSDLGNILAYYLDKVHVIGLSDLGNILAYYLDKTTLLYKYCPEQYIILHELASTYNILTFPTAIFFLKVHAHYRHELVFFWRFSRPRGGAHYATLMMVVQI
jgi:hypothetical protein